MEQKRKIYIVEDDPLICLDVRQALTDFGYEVVGATDTGEDAIQNIPPLKPDFVLMDISLKGKIDGIEAASHIGKQLEVPIVFLTGLTDEATLQRAKLTLPYGYLIKPFDPSELRSAIELGLYRHSKDGTAAPSETAPEEIEQQFEVGEGEVDKKLEVLLQLDLFKDVPRGDLETFAQAASLRSFDGGEFILAEEEEAKAGFIVLSGKVAITKSAVTGKELIVSLLGSGDTFGLFYLLKGFSGCCSARTQVASRVLWVPENAFTLLENRAPNLARALTESLARRLGRSYELASSLAHSRVEDRIVTAILTLLPELGRGGDKGSNNGRIFMTRKELADLTGTTPETAIRITKNLEREGILDLSRPGIIKIVDLASLQQMTQH
ncbi:MAG: response regulator [Deltaproteobacteria bacterium]|nr:response regulator [Deltaproteobacteria bacterium]